ncbi:uncharacterized protein V1518DRAFT_374655, partial [Limtongia smithiae]|uniref:uncharacterized protein n=1 Tax=Limtongia smithiae TaxID=1125753 RepID=UPI0034CF7DC0
CPVCVATTDIEKRENPAVICIDGNFRLYHEDRVSAQLSISRCEPTVPYFRNVPAQTYSDTQQNAACGNKLAAARAPRTKSHCGHGAVNVVCRHGISSAHRDLMSSGEPKRELFGVLDYVVESSMEIKKWGLTYDIACRYPNAIQVC